MSFKSMIKEKEKLNESPVGDRGRTSVKDAHAHITPELEKEFFKVVQKIGGKTVANVLLNKITIATVGTSDSNLKKYQDNNFITARKNRGSLTEVEILMELEAIEDILIKNNIKIRSKFSTKFGTEFILFKTPNKDEITDLLKNYKVSFDNKSIFVS